MFGYFFDGAADFIGENPWTCLGMAAVTVATGGGV